MNDYSAPLLDAQAWLKCYADAMRAKRWDIAEGAAVKIVRIGVDLIDHAEAMQKKEAA